MSSPPVLRAAAQRKDRAPLKRAVRLVLGQFRADQGNTAEHGLRRGTQVPPREESQKRPQKV